MARSQDATARDLTSFVGRHAESAAVRRLLSTSRIVTLSGIGGVGKTRLALRVSGEARRAFPDGVHVVELASLKDPSLLAHVVLKTLGIRAQSARSPMDVIHAALRDSHALLVLDNCEQVIDAASDFVDDLVREAPNVKVLATSIGPLHVAGEHVFAVAPLPTPDPASLSTPGLVAQYPAVLLFTDRAAAAVPGFELTAANEAAVVEVCRRLEGIPLAIELAAVRLTALSVEDLASRLHDRFELLRGGDRHRPERHRTLRAVIDWSFELCTPTEQLLWTRASVFNGGFSLEALEMLCGDDSLPSSELLDLVSGLIDKSVFTREEVGGRVRFGMLETIRGYGHEKLIESGAEREMRRRHRDWCLGMLESAEDEWEGARQQVWSTTLQAEVSNLRRAFEWSLNEPGEQQVALRMTSVPWIWISMGYCAEGRLWIERALALELSISRERAWALATAAYLATSQGDHDAAIPLIAEARAVATEIADDGALAYVTHAKGTYCTLTGDVEQAADLFSEALDLYRSSDVPAYYADLARVELASVHLFLGNLDQASELLEDLHLRATDSGERWSLSYALWGRGFLALLRGELDDAEVSLCEAIRIKRDFHDTLGLAYVFDVLAWTAAARDEAQRSAELLGVASALWSTIGASLNGSPHLIAHRDRYESQARRALGDAAFDAAVERGRRLSDDDSIAKALRERPVVDVPETGEPSALTPRETEVAQLIAEGMSNKDIAARLVISVRTAEAHVEHIRTKLGFRARTQIASWMARQGDGLVGPR